MYVLIALPPALLIVSAVGFATVVYMTIIVKAFTMDVIYQLILAILLSELMVLYLIRDYVHESMSMGRAFVLLPIYWFLLGTVTITSPFIPINNWLKTTR